MSNAEFFDPNVLRDRFSSVIVEGAQLDSAGKLDARLLIARSGELATYYAPFEYLNQSARVVIVGLTPGRNQMEIALLKLRERLMSGDDWQAAVRAAKYTASFGGPMRANLVAMLDLIGVNRWLGLTTCDSLFSTDSRLAHHTSVLRYPVFLNGLNYSGRPEVLRTPFLIKQVGVWFATELPHLRDAILVPLGGAVERVLLEFACKGRIDSTRVICGLPHPSGANAERIAYFLGRKSREALSRKTNPTAIDDARARLIQQLRCLPRLGELA